MLNNSHTWSCPSELILIVWNLNLCTFLNDWNITANFGMHVHVPFSVLSLARLLESHGLSAVYEPNHSRPVEVSTWIFDIVLY